MKYHRYLFLPFLAVLVYTDNVLAHVSIDYPVGGEEFFAGDTVNVQWHLEIPHNQEDWDLYFSPDGGQTWQVIGENIPTVDMSYDWIVPDIETSHARVRIVQDNMGSDYEDACGDFVIHGMVTSVNRQNISPEAFRLYENYPNPFNPTTTISYSLSEAGPVKLEIYNLLGQRIRTLVKGYQDAKFYQVKWDGRDSAGEQVGSGFYIYRLQSGHVQKSRRMILLK